MNGKEKIIFSEDCIEMQLQNFPQKYYVMHRAEESLMHKLADIATQNGGSILEVGFGMGLSADRIQSNPNILSHTIIEVHPEIYKKAIDWAKDKKNVTILLGDWFDVIPKLENIKYDGVLHDTCADPNINKFIDIVKPFCNNKCIVAFFLNKYDTDLNSITHNFNETEYNRLPYKNSPDFKNQSYELKYKIVYSNM
jgi:hypothetical protein